MGRWLVLAVVMWGACAPTRAPVPEAVPSVVLIVVDTLRADFLGDYGHPHDTMPEVRRRLVERGVLFERAYAPAPWTLPSMVGLFSGRRPGRDLGDHPSAFRFPDDRPTPAELLASTGRATAAFVGNPLLGPATGFDRGFSTFWVAESEARAMERPGRELTDRALEWLEQTSNQPIFLWLHYIEPHDPYLPPDLVRGLDPSDVTYRGDLTGRDVHALFAGRRTSADPERDARYFQSLYRGELRAVDREIGRLLDGLAERLPSTLVILASDHGEEFYEHGGWKHGRTVFDEQLRVPLVLRWDGELTGGSRVESAVSLLDVVPTLAEALGLPVPPGLDGESLLPRARGEAVDERPLTAAHFHTGPLRPSVRLGRSKLVLFDRDAEAVAESPLDAHLLADERSRLPRLALFDLDADPAETHDLSRSRPDLTNQLALFAFDGLDRDGRVVAILGLEPGETLELELDLDGPEPGWQRLFLAPADVVRLAGTRLSLALVGDGLPKAVVLGASALPLRLSTQPSEAQPFEIVDGGVVVPKLPAAAGIQIATWRSTPDQLRPPRSRDPELAKTLKSLGYAQ